MKQERSDETTKEKGERRGRRLKNIRKKRRKRRKRRRENDCTTDTKKATVKNGDVVKA